MTRSLMQHGKEPIHTQLFTLLGEHEEEVSINWPLHSVKYYSSLMSQKMSVLCLRNSKTSKCFYSLPLCSRGRAFTRLFCLSWAGITVISLQSQHSGGDLGSRSSSLHLSIRMCSSGLFQSPLCSVETHNPSLHSSVMNAGSPSHCCFLQPTVTVCSMHTLLRHLWFNCAGKHNNNKKRVRVRKNNSKLV